MRKTNIELRLVNIDKRTLNKIESLFNEHVADKKSGTLKTHLEVDKEEGKEYPIK